jgi:beta-D-xylosidase 4
MRNLILAHTTWLLSMALIDAVSSRTCLPPYAANLTYAGCYQDPNSPRDLSGPLLTVGSLNSPQYCANICGAAGYTYSGVEYTM